MRRFVTRIRRGFLRAALWVRRVVTEPLHELDRWQRAARFCVDLVRYGARRLEHDRAEQMAAALAFRTLFGLLPVLVVATLLVKALGMEQYYLEPLSQLFEFWGLQELQVVAPANGEIPSVTLDEWLKNLVHQAERVNVAAIGWVGVAVTIYAAISLLVTIENSFNIIYRASQGRAWTSRVPIYWFVLTISPLIIISSSFVDGRFQEMLRSVAAQGWLSSVVGVAWSFFAFWLLMIAAYMLFPNTQVRLRPALAGAAVSAVLLEIGKRTMGMYLRNALSVSQLYGSLGLIPLFMFWVYLMWLAVLFGLQVSAVLQHLHGRRIEELGERPWDSALVDPATVVVLMQRVASRFRSGRATALSELAEELDLAEPMVERLTRELIDDGLLHRLVEEETKVVLARPPEQISTAQLLELAAQLTGRSPQDDAMYRFLERVRTAERDAAASLSLADLISQ